MLGTVRNFMLLLLTLALLTASLANAADSKQDTSKAYYHQEDQGVPIMITPDKLKWDPIDVFPGAYCAVINGNPSKQGQYIVRLKFPSNYKILPNWQTATVNVTVMSGTIHIGVGDKFDRENGKTLRAGSSIIIPSKSHLYFWTTQEAVLQVHGLGPWDLRFVDPANDPRTAQPVR